jgi:hypothetical protein
MKAVSKSLLFLAAFMIICCTGLHAEWVKDGVPVCSSTGDQWYGYIASDEAGGAIITWSEVRYDATYRDLFAQRLDSDGNTLWRADGVSICTVPEAQLDPYIIPDGSGGAVIAWRDYRNGNYDIYAQRIDADGNILWASNGVPVSVAQFGQYGPTMFSDGYSGFYIAWADDRTGSRQIRCNKLNSDGTLAWGPDGIIIRDTPWWQDHHWIVSDGTGGAIIAWDDVDNGFTALYIFAQRIGPDGSKLWDPNGVLIEPTGGVDHLNPLSIAPSGDGGAIIAWGNWCYLDNYYDIYVQKVGAAGVVEWSPFGYRICNASGEQRMPRIVSDGENGAIVSWLDIRSGRDDFYAQRVGPNGTALWATDGIPIRIGPPETGFGWPIQVTSDHAGGAIFTWQEGLGTPTSWDIYAQRVDGTGTLLWPDTAVSVCRAHEGQYYPQPTSDGENGAIITWRDMRQDTIGSVYAMRVRADGQIVATLLQSWAAQVEGTNILIEWTLSDIDDDAQFFVLRARAQSSSFEELASAVIQRDGLLFTCIDSGCEPGIMYFYRIDVETADGRRTLFETEAITIPPPALALHQNYPNPFNPSTTIRYTLPERTLVTIEVFDIAGRKIACLVSEEQPAGPHSIEWDGRNERGAEVSSGVYLYRLTAGKKTIQRKMVLLR